MDISDGQDVSVVIVVVDHWMKVKPGIYGLDEAGYERGFPPPKIENMIVFLRKFLRLSVKFFKNS